MYSLLGFSPLEINSYSSKKKNGKKSLLETPVTGAFFPAMLMSPSSETCENMHMGTVIGGHNHFDTNSGLYGSSKKDPQINGVAPQW